MLRLSILINNVFKITTKKMTILPYHLYAHITSGKFSLWDAKFRSNQR